MPYTKKYTYISTTILQCYTISIGKECHVLRKYPHFKNSTFHAQRRCIKSGMFQAHLVHVNNSRESSNAILSAVMHDQFLHDEKESELISDGLSVRVQFSVTVDENVSAFFIVTFESDEEALSHHTQDPVVVHVPVVKPLRTVGFDGVEEVQLFFGPFQTEFAASQKVQQ